jgi:hypothetical protein
MNASIAIDGRWRYNTTTVQRAHPGGAAGVYGVFVTAKANSIVNSPAPNTDATDYSFALAIVAGSGTPSIVAGSVDIFQRVGELSWDGVRVTRVRQFVGDVDWTPPIVTSLPLAPKNGDEVIYAPTMGDAPTPRWRMQYRSSDGVWVFLGGGPASVFVNDPPDFAGMGGGFIYMGTRLAMPRGGIWRLEGGVDVAVSSGAPAAIQVIVAMTTTGGTLSANAAALGAAPCLTSSGQRGYGSALYAVTDVGNTQAEARLYVAAPGHTVTGTTTKGTLYATPVALSST